MAYTTIKKPKDFFDEKIYLGSSSAVTVSGLDFQPDWVWVKDRDNGNNHCLVDAVRGVGKYIQSDNTAAEINNSTNSISAFTSDGFTTGTGNPANEPASNTNGFISWNWKANGAGVANTNGSISSTVSASATSGFSIVSYTGTGANATVGHGLGSAPKMIIAKNLDSSGASAEHWPVFHNSLDTNKNLYLNLANTEDVPSPEIYRKGSFTNNVFAIGAHDRINKSGEAMIAYCFADVQGFSKIGKYIGNASADGAFIYTGFSPAFVIIKNIDAAESWSMFDGKRPDSNQTNGRYQLQPNTVSAEYQNAPLIDLVSNGFKLRTSTNSLNVAQNYVYIALAEQPLIGDNPATAR